jgi:hypothetical protein
MPMTTVALKNLPRQFAVRRLPKCVSLLRLRRAINHVVNHVASRNDIQSLWTLWISKRHRDAQKRWLASESRARCSKAHPQ